jgi:RimJ/RimL family protein N-acetyltransferase
MLFEIKTDRLVVRDIRQTDHAFLVELLNDPGFIENIGDRLVRTNDQATNYIKDSLIPSYLNNGFGMYLVELKDGTPLGMCGMLKRDDLEYPDIGFAFLEKHRSQGYAYESAKAVLDNFKLTRTIDNVFGITKQKNISSRKLLQRLGLSFIKMISFNGDNATCLYGLKPLDKEV